MFIKKRSSKSNQVCSKEQEIQKETAAKKNSEAAIRLEEALEKLGTLKNTSDMFGKRV